MINRYLIIVLIGLTSCDLFSTRTPSAPDMGGTYIWITASTPSQLLKNFKGTLEELDAANHEKCFISDKDSTTGSSKLVYQFIPRPGLDAASQSIFADWSTVSERLFIAKLQSQLVKNPKATVIISNETIDQSDVHSAQVSFTYTILLPVEPSSTIPPSISGTAVTEVELITTEQSGKEWRFVKFSDFPLTGSSDKCLTDLKVQMNL
jgi:hypothetical protein